MKPSPLFGPAVHPASRPPAAILRCAYLNSQYPALSHTFIEREIRALRTRGVHIETFSVRRPDKHGCLGGANQDASRETFYLLDGPMSLVSSVLRAIAASPAGFLRALVFSQRCAPPGLRSRLVHVAYAFEGIRLALELRRRALCHVHVHMANNGASVAMLACRYDTDLRYSLSVHGPSDFFRVDTLYLATKVAHAVFVRCISNFCRAQLMAWVDPRHWGKLHVVHCGVDTSMYRPRPAREGGPLRLLAVGRLHPVKGYRVLLGALATLVREGHAVELDIVGDGPERGALERWATALVLRAHVVFSGPVAPELMSEHFDRADALVVSSFAEGVPVVLMEAGAKELGAVATKVAGIPELVADGVSGFLVDAGSVEALVAPLRTLVLHPELCRRHGRAGRERVIAGYSLESVGDAMRELFDTYLRSDPTAVHRASVSEGVHDGAGVCRA